MAEDVTEAVVLPDHYARWPLEPIFFIMANGMDYARGNIIKYIMRWDAKDGLNDLYKAARYLEEYTTMEEEKLLNLSPSEMSFWEPQTLEDVLANYIRRNNVVPTPTAVDRLAAYVDLLRRHLPNTEMAGG